MVEKTLRNKSKILWAKLLRHYKFDYNSSFKPDVLYEIRFQRYFTLTIQVYFIQLTKGLPLVFKKIVQDTLNFFWVFTCT